MLNLLQRNLIDCSKETKSTAYISLVRPLLEYASCVWDPHYDSHVLELEKVQRRAAQWVCSDYNFNASVITLLNQLLWQTLGNMLNHNTIHHYTALEIPNYYKPMQSSTRIFHHLRFIPHLTATSSYRHSYFPSSIKLWNNLPNTLLDCYSHIQFFSNLFKYMFK